ncbi:MULTISPECIES: C39 family peptidase [Cytobacillus]|nr:C39 family peptidase [Cytobacillus oceanisediminis]MCM3402911.1 C39 family peptidase [Cytobacillus oceanisediminis]
MNLFFTSIIMTFIISLSVLLFLGREELMQLGNIQVSDNLEQTTRVSVNSKEYNKKMVKIKDQVLLDVSVIKQFPELPRGCEVTSLAMLLQYKGVKTNKITLAQKIKKNSVPLKKEGGKIFWGDPNEGFVGDMYSYKNPGLGVYHKPIRELAEEYLPDQIVDLTGKDFVELQTYLSLGIPIWIITNTSYNELPDSSFVKWFTPNGEIKITYKEHSVLITGYDENSIYFNDPIDGMKNKSISKGEFLAAWKQMGSQAVTYLPE